MTAKPHNYRHPAVIKSNYNAGLFTRNSIMKGLRIIYEINNTRRGNGFDLFVCNHTA